MCTGASSTSISWLLILILLALVGTLNAVGSTASTSKVARRNANSSAMTEFSEKSTNSTLEDERGPWLPTTICGTSIVVGIGVAVFIGSRGAYRDKVLQEIKIMEMMELMNEEEEAEAGMVGDADPNAQPDGQPDAKGA